MGAERLKDISSFDGFYNADTKLVRFGARDYDPETGRFTSKDPILFNGGSPNLYSYTMNDPVNFTDPNGLWAVVIGGGFSGVFGGGMEGSGGIYFGSGSGGGLDFGFFGSGGTGFGANVGVDVFGGYFPGDTSTISGPTTNYNIGGGPVTASGFYDENSCKFVGGTVGLGYSIPPVSGSVTFSNTGTVSIPGLFNQVFGY